MLVRVEVSGGALDPAVLSSEPSGVTFRDVLLLVFIAGLVLLLAFSGRFPILIILVAVPECFIFNLKQFSVGVDVLILYLPRCQ